MSICECDDDEEALFTDLFFVCARQHNDNYCKWVALISTVLMPTTIGEFESLSSQYGQHYKYHDMPLIPSHSHLFIVRLPYYTQKNVNRMENLGEFLHAIWNKRTTTCCPHMSTIWFVVAKRARTKWRDMLRWWWEIELCFW